MELGQKAKAVVLRDMHDDGVLVLPNAWDAGSAVLVAAAGARAVGTTSGGVSWALGRPDGHGVGRADMAAQVARIAAAVDLPVTADIEGGYGRTPEDVAATVEAVVRAGAVGVNIEDSVAPGLPLFTADEQAARVRAARRAAAAAGLPELVVNVRTDVHLFGIGEPEGRFDDVVKRSAVYAEAGADCLFPAGLVDLAALAALVDAVSLPVNAMAVPNGPTVAEFASAGVRRISLGTALSQVAYGAAQRAAAEALTEGTFTALADAVDFGSLNGAFPR